MKVLFVCSGNSNAGISPIIKRQGESLLLECIDLEYFKIRGKGIIGYLRNIPQLRKKLKDKNYDLIHAHYARSGWISLLSIPKIPLIISFMGCDIYGDVHSDGRIKLNSYFDIILSLLLQIFVDKIIVKSKNLEKYIFRKKKTFIIPNGVDLNIFKPIDMNYARNRLGLESNIRLILFLGDSKNERKNKKLLEEATKLLQENSVRIINPYPVPHEQIPFYMNASNLLVLTSFLEGSPNAIKEAMACNLSIVTTDVGDVKEVIGNTAGCYLTTFDPADVAEKIKLALDFGKRTNGRENIKHLDSKLIAQKIITIYEQCLKK